MSSLDTFFAGSNTHFGIFFPTGYLVAIFPGLPEASQAEHSLRQWGFSESEILVVPGVDVVDHAHENLEKGGLWGLLMAEVSRLIGTEAVYADQDLQMAREGCAFLALHVPDKVRKQEAWTLLEPLNALVVRYYTKAGVELFRGRDASAGLRESELPLH